MRGLRRRRFPADWRARTTEEAARLRGRLRGARAREARGRGRAHARGRARERRGAAGRSAGRRGRAGSARAPSSRGSAGPSSASSPLELAGAGAAALGELRAAVDDLASAAEARLSAAEARLAAASRARSSSGCRRLAASRPRLVRLTALKQAETWLLGAADALREERLAPIREAAIANWNLLRHESNVSLGAIKLTGKGTLRHAEFDVSVDETGARALGVMSQGELHALALSVFLPRAMREESPFRFVMIDDPVQSMDPAKVDGLARVLARARRRGRSSCSPTTSASPKPCAGSDSTRASRRCTAGPTRSSRRASSTRRRGRRSTTRAHSCATTAFRRWSGTASCRRSAARRSRLPAPRSCVGTRLGRGDAHASVDEALLDANTLYQRVALALFDDARRTNDVLGPHRQRVRAAGGGRAAALQRRRARRTTTARSRGPRRRLLSLEHEAGRMITAEELLAEADGSARRRHREASPRSGPRRLPCSRGRRSKAACASGWCESILSWRRPRCEASSIAST